MLPLANFPAELLGLLCLTVTSFMLELLSTVQKENSGAWLWCSKDDFMIDAIRKVQQVTLRQYVLLQQVLRHSMLNILFCSEAWIDCALRLDVALRSFRWPKEMWDHFWCLILPR